MRILDLFCCQGGASAGYETAGFEVTGVDLSPQPRYEARFPGRFVRADALEFVAARGHEFDAIHASPPCQGYSVCQRIRGREHPDLIAATRRALQQTGRPYVIENVPDSAGELRDPVTLCGAAFGVRTYRHRLFEAGGGLVLEQPDHAEHTAPTVKMGRPLAEGDWYHAVGNFSNVPYVRADLGVPWMSRDGIRECIPPAYAAWVGVRLRAAVGEATQLMIPA